MSTLLSNLVDNVSDRIHKYKCKYCKSKLSYMSVKDNQLIFQCFACKTNYEKEFDMEFIKMFSNMYQFCKGDINKFVLLLRKSNCPYEYVDSWERFDETSLPDKKVSAAN